MQTTSPGDQALRYYHLQLQPDLLGGWMLVREWGPQGSPGRTRRDYFEEWDAALEAMTKVRDMQTRRGYRVVFSEGSERPA